MLKTKVLSGILMISVLCSLPIASGKEHVNIIAITGGTLIDGTGAEPLTNHTIIINGDTIESVGPSVSTTIPENAMVIDITGKWILPGFIDLHHHLGYSESVPSMATLRALDMTGYSHTLNAGFIDCRLNFLEGVSRGDFDMAESRFVHFPDRFPEFPRAVGRYEVSR